MNKLGLVTVGLTALTTLCCIAGAASAQERTPPMLRPTEERPAADRPLIRTVEEPKFAVEGGGGVLGYIGGAAGVGPAWNVRVSAIFSPDFAGELSYTGAANNVPRRDDTLVMTALDAQIRYNVLRADDAVVQPFVAGGIGYAGFSGEDSDAFTMTIPVSAGVDRMLTSNVKIGARFNVKPAFFDELGPDGATDTPGGDTWSVAGNVGGAF